MSGEAALGSIAEVGAAFTGFVAILTVLGSRGEHLSAADSLRAQGLMVASILATLFALSPFAFYELGLRDAVLWRSQSGIALAGVLVGGFFQRRSELRADPAWSTEIGRPTIIAAWGCTAAAVLTLLGNSSGLLSTPSSGLHVLGLLLLLATASALFLSVVFQRFL